MWRVLAIAIALTVAAPIHGVWADDLTGSSRFLCAAVQATVCIEDGQCAADVPWNLNIPDFVEVDLEMRQLATTRASGENRTTPIEHLSRHDGTIVLHGFERGRAFSFVIDEESGRVSVSLVADGITLAIFGTCTPMTTAPDAASD